MGCAHHGTSWTFYDDGYSWTYTEFDAAGNLTYQEEGTYDSSLGDATGIGTAQHVLNEMQPPAPGAPPTPPLAGHWIAPDGTEYVNGMLKSDYIQKEVNPRIEQILKLRKRIAATTDPALREALTRDLRMYQNILRGNLETMGEDPDLAERLGDVSLERVPGGSAGGWWNPFNWLRGLYTGNPNASDGEYAAALNGAGESYNENKGAAHATLDAVAAIDPTPLSDAVQGTLYTMEGASEKARQSFWSGAQGPVGDALKRLKQGRRIGSLGGVADDAAGASNPLRNLPKAQQRAVESLRKRIAEHQQKLRDYISRPDAFDNQGLLKNAPTPEIRQKIIDGRIRHLENEIKAFQDQINRILGGGT